MSDLRGWRPNLSGLDFNRIDGDNAAKFKGFFLHEEVFVALFDLNGDKALGLVP